MERRPALAGTSLTNPPLDGIVTPIVKRRWKFLLIAGILAAMALDVRTYLVWKSEQGKIGELAEELGLVKSDPEAVEEALKDPDSVLARMWLARALYRRVEAEIGDPAKHDDLVAPLEDVYSVAFEVWHERPVNCEAAALAGSARYLAWSLANDRRRVTEAKEWEGPLLAARELCPQDSSHIDMLGGAYLELWFYLSDGKKEIAKEVVRDALAQSDRLAELWLATAPTRPEAWELLPPRPSLWLEVQGLYAARGEWLSAIEAREHWREVSRLAAEESLVEAGSRAAKGERALARRILSRGVFNALPLESGSAPLVEQALVIWPDPPRPGRREWVLKPWLDWSLELCTVATCPLSSHAIARLGALIPDLPAPKQGQALLLGGQRALAEILEPSETGDPAWDPYWLTKARVMASSGDFEAVQEALERLGDRQGQRPLTWWAASVARSKGLGEASPDFQLGPWRSSGYTWVQEMAAQRELSGLTLVLPEVQTLLEVELDGTRLGPFPPQFGSRLELPQSLGAGPHHLLVRSTEEVKLSAPRTEISGRL